VQARLARLARLQRGAGRAAEAARLRQQAGGWRDVLEGLACKEAARRLKMIDYPVAEETRCRSCELLAIMDALNLSSKHEAGTAPSSPGGATCVATCRCPDCALAAACCYGAWDAPDPSERGTASVAAVPADTLDAARLCTQQAGALRAARPPGALAAHRACLAAQAQRNWRRGV
jgi:hypothetical protein